MILSEIMQIRPSTVTAHELKCCPIIEDSLLQLSTATTHCLKQRLRVCHSI